ncbi:MAG: RNA-binding protein, partial [Ginsengibacter sp.]
GNQGLNNQMKPTVEEPVTIDAADIDNNGTVDALISYFIQGKSYPMASRDELLYQIPTLKAKFPSYESYSNATVKDIFPPEQFAKAIHLKADEFRSGVFINNNGTFHFEPFPIEAQIFPVRDLVIDDFNHDGLKDILLTGNDYTKRVQSGRDDAGKGLLLLQNKAGGFLPVTDSGFQTDKDARKIIRIENSIIVANNNDWLQIFKMN